VLMMLRGSFVLRSLLTWRVARWVVLGAVVPIWLLACTARSFERPNVGTDVISYQDIAISQNRDIDILFLVDKSPTMKDEQQSLAENFPRFIEVLERSPGGLPNVHIGVITQDIGAGGFSTGGTCKGDGDAGRLQNTPRVPGCSPPSGTFISDVANADGTRQRNYTGALADTFSCIAQVGPDGCGFEQHLESLKRALDGSVPENAGFIRPDAYLGIIILSDEDDCSAFDTAVFTPVDQPLTEPLGPLSDFRCAEFGWTCDGGPVARASAVYTSCEPRQDSPFLNHPQVYADFVKSLKPADPSLIIASAIIGDGTRFEVGPDDRQNPEVKPSCGTSIQNAEPMPRVRYFTEQFTGRNTFASICAADFSASLVVIAEQLAQVIGNRCLSNPASPADLDPDQPGVQPECQAAEVRLLGDGRKEETVLRRCEMADAETPAADSPSPCWYVVPDAASCAAAPGQLSIRIHPSDRMPPPGTRLRLQCLGA
jgi:hypothetical protein